MKTKFITICVILIALVLLSAASAYSQDFDALLKEVDHIETKLKQGAQQEVGPRSKTFVELSQMLTRTVPNQYDTSDSQWLDKFERNLRAYSILMDQMLATYDLSASNNTDLLEVVTGIQCLIADIGMSRSKAGQPKGQLVSLDNEGFYLPQKNDNSTENSKSRLAELEATVADMASSVGLSNPSVKHGTISIGGIVHQHFVNGPEETSSFVSKRARLALKGDINEFAQIKIQAEFAGAPKLLDGQITISPNSNWSISIGQYQPPFGTDFLTSVTSTPFVNRSMAVGLGTDRDVGGAVSFRTKFNSDYSLKLTTGMFNGSGINTSDINNSKNFVARLETTLLGMFTFSPNIMVGKTNHVDSLKGDLLDVGSSLSWNWGQEIVELEYIQSEHADVKRSGWYIWGAHLFSTGTRFLPELQLLARYEQLDPNVNSQDDRTDRVTLGTNLFIDNKYTKIQLNYQINTEQGAEIDNNEFLVNFQLAF